MKKRIDYTCRKSAEKSKKNETIYRNGIVNMHKNKKEKLYKVAEISIIRK